MHACVRVYKEGSGGEDGRREGERNSMHFTLDCLQMLAWILSTWITWCILWVSQCILVKMSASTNIYFKNIGEWHATKQWL